MRIFDPEQNGHFNYMAFAEGLYKHAGLGRSSSSGGCCDPRDRAETLGRARSETLGHQFDDDIGLDLQVLRMSLDGSTYGCVNGLNSREASRTGSWFRGSRDTIHHDDSELATTAGVNQADEGEDLNSNGSRSSIQMESQIEGSLKQKEDACSPATDQH